MTVYLIHFQSKYKHSQHYIGYAYNLEGRIYHHRHNTGARLLQVINAAGIKWDVVRTWENGNRTLERRLKNWKKSSDLCPICNPDRWAMNARNTSFEVENAIDNQDNKSIM